MTTAATVGKKLLFFFQMKDERPFGFASMWKRWQGADQELVESGMMLTTNPNEVLRLVHERMPVLFHPDGYEFWLDLHAGKIDLIEEFLQPCPA